MKYAFAPHLEECPTWWTPPPYSLSLAQKYQSHIYVDKHSLPKCSNCCCLDIKCNNAGCAPCLSYCTWWHPLLQTAFCIDHARYLRKCNLFTAWIVTNNEYTLWHLQKLNLYPKDPYLTNHQPHLPRLQRFGPPHFY